jgi:MarR family transcriptional regulator for hemolysin
MAPTIKSLGETLGPLRGIIAKQIKINLKNEGIVYTLEQLMILKIIGYYNKTLVQQDIAEILSKDKSVVLRMVGVLEKENLLKRVVDPNDKRRNLLGVTEQGEQMIERFNNIGMKVSKELMKNLSEKEIDTFYKVIDQIKTNSESL